MSILGSILGSVVKSNATGKAKDALVDAAGQAQTSTVGAANNVIGLNAPGVDLYGRSINALSQRAGLGGNLGSANLPTQGVAPSSGGAPAGDLTGMSASENGAAPSGNALTPDVGAPAISPGSFGDLSNPTLNLPSAPTQLSTSANDFAGSPDYRFLLDRGTDAVNSDFAHRGALNSGAAMKGIADYASGLASTKFNDWRDFNAGENAKATAQFNTDRTNAQSQYADSRDYLTGQYNQQTQDLTGLANGGANALSTTGNALTQIGSAGALAATNIGNAKAGSALQKGNIWSNTVADVDGQLQSAATKFLPF